MKILGGSNNSGEIEISMGIQYRNHGNTPTGLLAIDITPAYLSYDKVGDNNIFGEYIVNHFKYAIKGNVRIVADVEYGRSSGNEKNFSGHLNFKVSF